MVGLDDTYQPSVIELAQAGNLRAIGYWINSFLVPQGIYVRVGRSKSGCLHLMVEFERQPDRDRLVRFICHRLCRLRCSVFGTVRIVARFFGSTRILWSQSIRLRTHRSAAAAARGRGGNPTSSSLALYQPRLRHPAELQRRRRQIAIGGSAAALLLGYGFQAASQRPSSGVDRPPSPAARAVPRSNVVNTADDSVVVTPHFVANPADPTVTLTFSSDSALDQTPQPLSWDLSHTRDDRAADVALSNLENSLGAATAADQREATGGAAGQTSLEALTASSVDVVTLASDRLLEEGTGELAQTLNTLEQAGIRSVGAGRNQREARRPEILDVKGQRIAYLGYSDSVTNAAKGWRAGTNPALNDQIAADIQAIRNQVDWVIVNYHWSQDLAEYPGDWQMNLARFAIDQGADLVVGHHPNVLQGAEIYKGRAIAYSLGNFLFANPQSPQPQTEYDTAVLKVSLRDQQMRLEFLPIQVRQAKPEVATGETAKQVMQYIQQASGLFEQPMRSPTVLDVRSTLDTAPVPVVPISPPAAAPTAPSDSPADSFVVPPAPPVVPSPDRLDSFTAPLEAPAPSDTPSDPFVAPPASPPDRSDSFTTDLLPTDPTQTEEVSDEFKQPHSPQVQDAPPTALLSATADSAPDAVPKSTQEPFKLEAAPAIDDGTIADQADVPSQPLAEQDAAVVAPEDSAKDIASLETALASDRDSTATLNETP
jgi:poly-gamma-glutamate synthesis protein (capsule biosynthesis protein)